MRGPRPVLPRNARTRRARRTTRGACSAHMRRTSSASSITVSPGRTKKKHIGRTLKIGFLMSVTYVDQIHCNGMKSQKAITSNKAKVEAAGGNTSSGCYLKLFTSSRRLIGFFSLPDCYLQCKLISFQKQFFLPYHCNCACRIGTGTSVWPAFTLHRLHSLQQPAPLLLLRLFLGLIFFFFLP